MSQRVGGDILAFQALPKSVLASHAMEGIWAIPAIRNTRTFSRLGGANRHSIECVAG